MKANLPYRCNGEAVHALYDTLLTDRFHVPQGLNCARVGKRWRFGCNDPHRHVCDSVIGFLSRLALCRLALYTCIGHKRHYQLERC